MPTSTARRADGTAVLSGLLEDGVDAGEVARLRSREQVVEGEHRVGLAASEVGLELDHRVAALAVQAPYGAGQHALEAVGQVGPVGRTRPGPGTRRFPRPVRLPEIGANSACW